jgi:hypothetical protein
MLSRRFFSSLKAARRETQRGGLRVDHRQQLSSLSSSSSSFRNGMRTHHTTGRLSLMTTRCLSSSAAPKVDLALIKALRTATDAPITECKTALQQTLSEHPEIAADTDAVIDRASDWLRKNGAKTAAKKASRRAAEGLIAVEVDGGRAALVEVNSETDFVSRNGLFQGLLGSIARACIGHVDAFQGDSEGADARLVAQAQVGGVTVAEAVQSAVGTIKENIKLRRVAGVVAADANEVRVWVCVCLCWYVSMHLWDY